MLDAFVVHRLRPGLLGDLAFVVMLCRMVHLSRIPMLGRPVKGLAARSSRSTRTAVTGRTGRAGRAAGCPSAWFIQPIDDQHEEGVLLGAFDNDLATVAAVGTAASVAARSSICTRPAVSSR